MHGQIESLFCSRTPIFGRAWTPILHVLGQIEALFCSTIFGRAWIPFLDVLGQNESLFCGRAWTDVLGQIESLPCSRTIVGRAWAWTPFWDVLGQTESLYCSWTPPRSEHGRHYPGSLRSRHWHRRRRH